ncbi:MAG: hypothetical protein JWM29_2196, partial [Solirubrobacterales bacterium]|nr:hypothetical protein [Solirubrobacterales bacterium]
GEADLLPDRAPQRIADPRLHGEGVIAHATIVVAKTLV